MQSLPTAVLLHITAHSRHHDWLIAHPANPAGPLWTVRLDPPTSHWSAQRRFLLTRLPAHRRRYLHYQGPLTGHRGTVIRIDRGQGLCRLWTDRRIVLDLHFRHCRGRIDLRLLAPDRWLAHFSANP